MKKILLFLIVLLAIYSSITTYKLNNISPDIVHTTDTIPGDSVFTEVIVYKPKPYAVIVPGDTFKIPTDTAKLIEEYKNTLIELYTSKTYLDTLKNDSSALVVVNTSISRNSLDSLKMTFKNNRSTVINNYTINNEVKLKAGILAGYGSLTPIVSYKLNKDFNLLGGYDILNKNPLIGMLYNIK